MTGDAAALESVIAPLINAICPPKIKEPKTKIAILMRKVIEEQLGDAKYTDIVDRFLIGSAEKDPEGTADKLLLLHMRLGEILREV